MNKDIEEALEQADHSDAKSSPLVILRDAYRAQAAELDETHRKWVDAQEMSNIFESKYNEVLKRLEVATEAIKKAIEHEHLCECESHCSAQCQSLRKALLAIKDKR